jgi:type VI secretion system protein ImpJ
VGEGLFLRPQHFQRQDAYHEARLFESIQAIQPYNWGLRSVRIDRDALGSNVLRVAELALVFPDGALYAAPQADDLPPPIALDTLPDGINEFVFYLALHPLREKHQLQRRSGVRLHDAFRQRADERRRQLHRRGRSRHHVPEERR